MCRIIPMVLSCCVFASTFTFIAIAIDRFCLVVFPLRTSTQLGKKSCCIVIALIWFLSIVFCLPFALKHTVFDYMLITSTLECREFWSDEKTAELYIWGVFSLQFVMPLVVVTITNTCISVKLSCNVAPGTMSAERQKRENSRRRHMNRMLSLVVLCFAFCWLPLSVYSLYLFYDTSAGDCTEKTWEMCGSGLIQEEDTELFGSIARSFDVETSCKNSSLAPVKLEGSQYTQTIIHTATLTLAATNACFNPLLYAWMNDNFMREFMRLFARVPGLRALVNLRNKNCDYTSMNPRSKQQSQINTSCPIVETSFTATKRSSIDANSHDVQTKI
ncbi:prolactin-releasing peptide receptor-like [Antedon mediterranea]|uniref:prolactin-releasing peptide receptor-like n=1 Tax=Antedon mediterranea TaxID=105859 RepID=UPI003AF9EC6D